MALDPSATREFELSYETGSGRHKTKVTTKFKIDAKYEPIKALGHGAFGVVCSALNKETGQKVAIKKMTPMAESKVDGVHALREIRLMRWLGRHPNIITLKDLMVNLPNDELYIVMDLMDSDLHRIIQSSQKLEDAHFKHFMYQLLRGLRFAHSYGIIHRDLKPANLLVTKACDLVISDFGLARLMAGDDGPMTEHVVTRWYRAPELMLSADGHYTQSVDVWASGCIFAELLGRTPLFPGADFKQTIAMQMEVLGTRPDDELEYIRSEEALKFLRALPRYPKKPWAAQFPDATPKAIDLLERMLQFHPEKRISVEDALAHPYFDSVRSQYADPDPVLPVGPGGFEFAFETDDTLDATAFKRLIVEEAISFRAERAAARAKRASIVAGEGGADKGAVLDTHESARGSTPAAAAGGAGGAGGAPAGTRFYGTAGPATVVKS